MIRIYLEWHSHEVWTELGDCPHNRQTLQFSGRVRLFSLVQCSRSATDDALLALPNLSQDGTEACCRGISIQPKCLAEIRESCDRAGGEPSLELVKSGFGSLRSNERALPSWLGQTREWQ